MQQKNYCPDCEVAMDFHPITTDFMFTKFELENNEEFTGILDEFYSCPECGKTAMPIEDQPIRQAEKATFAYGVNF